MFRFIATVLIALTSTPALAATMTGPARLIDGDTISINGVSIRLHGIDAPETGQKCQKRNGKDWPCGKAALDALRALISGQKLTCTVLGQDAYDRVIATCLAGQLAINRAMVRQGYAMAYVKYSPDFKQDELAAQSLGLGIWQGPFERPWEFRARRWEVASQISPVQGCAIKGNINKGREKIYHTPWSRSYERTKVSPSKGERWFCSEKEAEAAGWRAPFN